MATNRIGRRLPHGHLEQPGGGRDEAEITATLESLIPRRLVRLDSPGMAAPGLAPTVEGEKKYRLGPFLVGWYEANMRLLDKEFAELFEQFVIEGGGERIFAPRPGVLGVVPVRGSLKPEWHGAMEPHLDIDAHFQRHERFLVIPCVCKREKELLHGHSCEQADEAMRLRRTAAADPARRERARPGGGVEAPRRARADGARSPRVLRLHHGSGDSAVRRHVQLLRLLLRGIPRPEARRSSRKGPEIELPRRHRPGEVHRLRRLHPALPGGRHLRGSEHLPPVVRPPARRAPEMERASPWSTGPSASVVACA